MIRLVVYSKDAKLRPLLAPALGPEFDVTAEPDGERAKDLVLNNSCDVLLLDLDTSHVALEAQASFYREINTCDTAVVLLTDDIGRATALELVQRGAFGYCRRPPALRELKPIIRRAYEHVTMKRELAIQHEADLLHERSPVPSCDGLIGGSPQLRNVYELVRRVADLNASVLITGESGTGKELIARAIHNLGGRAKSPFVAVSCGAIPETLIESELFGHEKGAFTGTTGTRTGFFEQAGSGTLFLDEIGELSLQTQVKLLRVLQQREFNRLGSNRPIPLRARVLFATHRDLPAMIAENKFRLDLYYRINVVSIDAPALADHPEDIPALTKHFLWQYSELYKKIVTDISPAASALLQEYDWPGNVRELENVIQSAIIRADGGTIEAKDLPERFQEQSFSETGENEIVELGSFERLLRDYKLKLATKAIEDCQGNKTLAARKLNISRAYLHRLVRLADDEVTDVA